MENKKSKRGFASMDPAKQRAIASKGGRTPHNRGFGTMDPEKQRGIARMGGMKSRRGKAKNI